MLRWNCKNGWDMRHQIIKVYLDAIYTFQKRLTSLNLRGTNQGNLVLEPLAVQHLDNRLYIKRSMLVASGWTPNAFNLEYRMHSVFFPTLFHKKWVTYLFSFFIALLETAAHCESMRAVWCVIHLEDKTKLLYCEIKYVSCRF